MTRIEKLADHIDGQSRIHPPAYIAEIKRYADLVLGAPDAAHGNRRYALKRPEVAA